MADILVSSDTGIQAIVTTPTPVTVVVDGALQGPAGPAGATGATGATGAAGVGVPTGGTTGQVLTKNSNSDYDTGWATPSGGGGGGSARVITSVTGTVTGAAAANTDYVYLLGSGAVYTQPAASSNTNRYTIKNTTGSNKTVARTSTNTLEGATSLTIGPNASVDLVSDGTSAWYVI